MNEWFANSGVASQFCTWGKLCNWHPSLVYFFTYSKYIY